MAKDDWSMLLFGFSLNYGDIGIRVTVNQFGFELKTSARATSISSASLITWWLVRMMSYRLARVPEPRLDQGSSCGAFSSKKK